MKSPIRFFQRQIVEIRNDRVLRFYGTCLAAITPLTVLFWIVKANYLWLGAENEAICWPMFENCREWHFFAPSVWLIFFIVFGIASFFPVVEFLRGKIARAYLGLALFALVKTAIVLLDYRLRLNQHIMAFFITLTFLFVPGKRVALPLTLLAFYFWAGLLKLDREWLSGSALYVKPWFFSGAGLAVACTYVVILELVIVWGLLFDRTKWAWAALAQLFIFHLFSFQIVGFFYPILCYLMLAIFPLAWKLDPKAPMVAEQIRQKKVSVGAIALLAVFSYFQILPKFFHGDTRITGEGRLFALHMFDSLTNCDGRATIRFKSGMKMPMPLHLPISLRIHCDPIVYLDRAREICYRNRSNRTFTDLDLTLKTKRSTETEMRTVINLPDFCSRHVEYSVFSSNDWILK